MQGQHTLRVVLTANHAELVLFDSRHRRFLQIRDRGSQLLGPCRDVPAAAVAEAAWHNVCALEQLVGRIYMVSKTVNKPTYKNKHGYS